jgi:hypothetical protein
MDVERLVRATGEEKRRILTRLMLTDERTFYGQCLCTVQSTMHIPDISENRRSTIIRLIADEIFDITKKDFKEAIRGVEKELEERSKKINKHVNRLTSHFRENEFDAQVYNSSWERASYDQKWERHTVETARSILERLKSGSISPKKITGEAQGKIDYVNDCTRIICNARERYREVRRESHNIIETALDSLLGDINSNLRNQGYKEVRKAALVPPDKRKMVAFIGGIGCGKSELMDAWWNKNSKTNQGFIVVNTDYTKQALAQRAVMDGKVVENNLSSSVAHEESAILSHEINRKYSRRAKGEFLPENLLSYVPNMVMETDVLDDQWKRAAFAGGGPVEIHYVSAPMKIIETSVETRNGATSRHTPSRHTPKDIIKQSSINAAQNLIDISQSPYNGTIYLYDRTELKGKPKYVGAVSLKNRELIVEDLKGFFAIASRSGMGRDEETSRLKFINALLDNGISINVLKQSQNSSSTISNNGTILCRLNSKRVFEYDKVKNTELPEEAVELKGISSTVVDYEVRGGLVTRYNSISDGAIR